MLAIILSACPSFLAHAACPRSRSRRPISQSAHPACCRMSEGATPSSELRVESFAPLVSPGQARKGVSFERRVAQLRAELLPVRGVDTLADACSTLQVHRVKVRLRPLLSHLLNKRVHIVQHAVPGLVVVRVVPQEAREAVPLR